jgi:cysteine-rich repeat protein
MSKIFIRSTIFAFVVFASWGCDLVLGLDDKTEPVPLLDTYETIDAELDPVDAEPDPVESDQDAEGEHEISPGCGNGTLEGGEECDDGNRVPGDGCENDCTFTCHSNFDCADAEICNGEETCDVPTHICRPASPMPDGFVCLANPRSICLSQTCVVSVCGDEFIDTGATPPEECDDGNTYGGDGCSSSCRIESGITCGDGDLDLDHDEQCDDGNRTAGDGCSPSCRFETVGASCGNGVIEAREVCDDSNADNGDACNPTCNLANATSLFVGSPGLAGLVDGAGAGARISGYGSMIVDENFIYLADSGNHAIRRIEIATAEVRTLAGNGTGGYVDDPAGANARFNDPDSIATDGHTLWVGDRANHRLRAMDLAPPYGVTTVAGSGSTSHTDGIGLAAGFDDMRGLAYYNGFVYLLDGTAATLRRFDPGTGEVATLAGSPYATGGTDGIGTAALFTSPRYMTSDNAGMMFIADTNGAKIRSYNTATGYVGTFAGNGTQDYVDGIGTAVRIHRPRGMTLDGTSLYWVEFNMNTVRQGILATVEVSTLAGTPGSTGYQEGVGALALFNGPYDIVFHFPTNSLFVLDGGNNVIRRIQ